MSLEASANLLNEERIHDESKGDFVVHFGIHNPPKVLTRKMLHDVMRLPNEILSEVDRIREVVLKLERGLNDPDEDINLDTNGDLVGDGGWNCLVARADE